MIKSRSILYLLYFTLLFGLFELIRDIFVLPFFGVRLYYIYFAILVFTYFSITLNFNNFLLKIKKLKFSYLTFFFLFIVVFVFLQILKNDFDFFFIFQLISFLLSLLFTKILVNSYGHNSFFKNLYSYSLFILFIMSIIWMLWFLNIGNLIDAKTRNSLPYLFLGIYFLSRNKKNILLLSFLIITFICETRGALLLLLITIIYNYFIKFFNSSNKILINRLLILFVLFFPIISIYIVALILNIDLEALAELENYRYYIDDGITSLISRIAGAGYVFTENFNDFYLIGSSNIYEIDKFWGYPIHNYLYLLILKYGIFGFLFSFFLIKISDKIMMINFSLGLTFLYCITNFNDLYIGFLIFLLPLINDKINMNESLKKFKVKL